MCFNRSCTNCTAIDPSPTAEATRFTDPDRSEYPDIDIDICQDGRQAILDYVRNKYGHVAQIITFGTLAAKAALKDVGRAMDLPYGDVDRLAKLVPNQINISLE